MSYLLTTRFYDRVRWYKQAERDILSAHTQAVKNAEKFRGSEGYKGLIEKADAERDAALNAEKATVRTAMKTIIAEMRRNIESRKVIPPTSEQVNLLSVLKMRGDSLTAAEIKDAANNMEGCPAALAVLSDLARSRGLVVGLKNDSITTAYALERLDNMERSIDSMMRGDAFLLRNVPESEAECLTKWAYLGWKSTPDGRNTELNQPLIDAFSAVLNGMEGDQ